MHEEREVTSALALPRSGEDAVAKSPAPTSGAQSSSASSKRSCELVVAVSRGSSAAGRDDNSTRRQRMYEI